MNYPPNTVTIHPYFKPHPGKFEAFKALLPKFVERTATEEKCLFYEFTINGEVIFCREGYIGGEGAVAHLGNVGDLLGEGMKLAEVLRLEFHGPAAELDKLRPHCEGLNAEWFVLECGVRR